MKRLKFLCLAVVLYSCQTSKNEQNPARGTFGHDLDFLQKYKEVLVLKAPDDDSARIAVIGDYQGRVMTSTAGGSTGNSYGWINYALIESGKTNPHINAFGGEERFWLSPEGGQFSVYFKKGDPFDFEHWQTPALIDTDKFDLVSSAASSATYHKAAKILNYSGHPFDLDITRKISVLSQADISKLLRTEAFKGLSVVAFETENIVKNTGRDWNKADGTLGIWILGMFNPSDETTMVIPAQNAKEGLTSNYFGNIPADRLKVSDSLIFFRADGKFRSKIGISPSSAHPVAGSYDAKKGILTIIQFDLNPKADYLKSTWEIHKEPFKGDAMNAYNDGPVADGTQMGPFYELESNSPTRTLKKGESMVHHHRTFHFEGNKEALNKVAEAVLGVKLETIESAFKK